MACARGCLSQNVVRLLSPRLSQAADQIESRSPSNHAHEAPKPKGKDNRTEETKQRDHKATEEDQKANRRKLPDLSINVDGGGESIAGGRNSARSAAETRRNEQTLFAGGPPLSRPVMNAHHLGAHARCPAWSGTFAHCGRRFRVPVWSEADHFQPDPGTACACSSMPRGTQSWLQPAWTMRGCLLIGQSRPQCLANALIMNAWPCSSQYGDKAGRAATYSKGRQMQLLVIVANQ